METRRGSLGIVGRGHRSWARRQQLSRGSAERRPGPSPSAGTSAGVGLVPKGRDALREVPVPQTRGLLAASQAAALSCPSPATQHQGAPVGRVLSQRTGQVPYVLKPATPRSVLVPGDADRAPRGSGSPGPFSQEVCLLVPLLPFSSWQRSSPAAAGVILGQLTPGLS